MEDLNIQIDKSQKLTENQETNLNQTILLGKKIIRFEVEKRIDGDIIKYTRKNNTNFRNGRWTPEEHIKFLEALVTSEMNWKKIKEGIGSRTLGQIRSHAQKFFKKLKKCKDESLGIDFTLNTINNFKDMINQIKSVNNNYNILQVLLYLSNKDELEIKRNNINDINGNDYIENSNIINNNFINQGNKNMIIIPQQIPNLNDINIDFYLKNILLLNSINNMNHILNFAIMNDISFMRYINNILYGSSGNNFHILSNYKSIYNQPNGFILSNDSNNNSKIIYNNIINNNNKFNSDI